MKLIHKEEGLYSVEAALCMALFAAFYVSLISLVTVVHAESSVQYALDKTAIDFSRMCCLSEDSGSSAEELCRAVFLGYLGDTAEKAGAEDLDMSDSALLEDGHTVDLVLEYRIRAGGMLTLNIRQRAVTRAWNSGSGSIWKKNNFVRGKYFVNMMKKEHRDMALKGGYGADLYDAHSGTVGEVYSLNIFSGSYYDKLSGSCADQIMQYCADMVSDVGKISGKEMELEKGGKISVHPAYNDVILILPLEAQTDAAAQEILNSAVAAAGIVYPDVTIITLYSEKAKV